MRSKPRSTGRRCLQRRLGAVSIWYSSTRDLVLLDSDIPRIDSVRIVRHLNEEGVPVAILSGDGKKVQERFKETRVRSWLYFPFGPAEIRALVQEAGKENAE